MRQSIASVALAVHCLFAAAAPAVPDCTIASRTTAQPFWVKGDRHNYDEAGAGYSVAFRGRYGFATVYIYDAEISDWTEGISDSRLRGQIEEVVAGVRELERRGRYSELNFSQPSERKFFCRDFLLLTLSGKLDGRPVQSAVAISVRNGKVLKFRATFYSEPVAGVEAETESLIREALASDTQ